MSYTDRTSDRADEPGPNDLASGLNLPNSGADDRRIPFTSLNVGERLGRRRLAELANGLSDRDLNILHALEDLHFLTTHQLERLLFPVGPLTPLAATRSCRRVLARLHQLTMVDRLERRVGGVRAGSASFIYSLSPNGARLLKTSARRRSREPSLAHLDHVLAVAELVVQLHEQSRAGHVDLLQLETEPDCWRPIVAAHGGQLLLKPDLRLALGVDDRELHWFVEQDNATEHRPVLARKLQTYRQAWHDGRITREFGVFPRVLWVVPSQQRGSFIQEVVETTAGLPAGMFSLAITEQAVAELCGQREQP